MFRATETMDSNPQQILPTRRNSVSESPNSFMPTLASKIAIKGIAVFGSHIPHFRRTLLANYASARRLRLSVVDTGR